MAEWFRALDLKYRGPWFKPTAINCYLDLFSVVPSSTPRPRCAKFTRHLIKVVVVSQENFCW